MAQRTGSLSIESSNVFTILKRWLYTEQDIVFRELVSNAADAIAKRQELVAQGASHPFEGRIDVSLDVESGVLSVSDNGLGMTEDEVDRYINNIAFSGATDFVAEHQREGGGQIIGHFGVGFYSAFMLTDDVQLESLSYRSGSDPSHWACGPDMAYEFTPGSRTAVGTTVTLRLSPDSPFVKDPTLVAAALRKYFAFLTVPVTFDGAQINDPDPLWKRDPESVDPEQLKAFYREHFQDDYDPLGWWQFSSPDIGVRGIIFIRNTRNGTEDLDGRFDVLSRGVFVESNSRALIPKFVNLQSGIVEVDDLPLVVSRSSVRSEDASERVQGLVFECLEQEASIWMNQMFTQERPRYEAIWGDLAPFVKYGCLTDKIFASVMTRKVVFADLQGRYLTLNEYLEGQQDHPNTVFYSSDPLTQSSYVQLYRGAGLPALVLDHVIDQPFLRRLEMTSKGVTFQRLDADLIRLFGHELDAGDERLVEPLTRAFSAVLATRARQADVRVLRLAVDTVPCLLAKEENSRRLGEAMEIVGLVTGRDGRADEVIERTLLVNVANPLIRSLAQHESEANRTLVEQLVDLALLSQGELTEEEMPAFVARSQQLLDRVTPTSTPSTE